MNESEAINKLSMKKSVSKWFYDCKKENKFPIFSIISFL